ncbi:MAG: DUF4976 domain-containing protein, partial [Chitinophagaceae bacterium]
WCRSMLPVLVSSLAACDKSRCSRRMVPSKLSGNSSYTFHDKIDLKQTEERRLRTFGRWVFVASLSSLAFACKTTGNASQIAAVDDLSSTDQVLRANSGESPVSNFGQAGPKLFRGGQLGSNEERFKFLRDAGVKNIKDNKLDGITLLPLITKNTVPARETFFWHYPSETGKWKPRMASSVRKGDYKLIQFYLDGRFELFNIKEDRYEKNNLEKSMPGKVEELKKILEEWKKDVKAEIPDLKVAAEGSNEK